MRRLALLALTIALPLQACGEGPGFAPIARVAITPLYVCAGDARHAQLTLDACKSDDPEDDPPDSARACAADADCDGGRRCVRDPRNCLRDTSARLCLHPLRYTWELDDDFRFAEPPGPGADLVRGTVSGERTVHLRLTVRDRDGRSGIVDRTLGISIPVDPPCDAGACAEGLACVAGACLKPCPGAGATCDDPCRACRDVAGAGTFCAGAAH